MPDEDNKFVGSLVSDFRKWRRHVQPKNWQEGMPTETLADSTSL